MEAAFERIFLGDYLFGTDTFKWTAKVVQRSRFNEIYQEITAHPITADLEAVKVLAGAPAVLNLFMCLCGSPFAAF